MGWTHTRSKIGVESRRNPHADLSELRHQLRVEKLEQHILEVVESAPGLNAEQAEKLAGLLRGGDGR
jgi:hypothetical protein